MPPMQFQPIEGRQMTIEIEQKVTHRCCPNCGHIVSQKEIQCFRFNFKCPKCKKHKVDDFQPMKMDRKNGAKEK